MNPLAALLIILALAVTPAALAVGGHNGLTLVAVLLAILGIALQISHPTDLRARDLFPLVREALPKRKAHRS